MLAVVVSNGAVDDRLLGHAGARSANTLELHFGRVIENRLVFRGVEIDVIVLVD